ncbi:MAG: FAD binding domain-containing protein, partial [Alphaproteobacteria bacterium]
MHDFAFHRPTSLKDARALFARCDDASYLAGGMTLLPTLKQRLAMPSDLIDLSAVGELVGITITDSTVTIGAMTPHAMIETDKALAAAVPVLAAIARQVADPMVRSRGTIGGSLANSDPAADWPAAALGLGATLVTDSREIAADDFFTGLFETALEPGEILTAIRIPRPRRAAYEKFSQPASGFALVGVLAAETADGPRVAVTGAAACVFRQTAMEQALAASWSADAVR